MFAGRRAGALAGAYAGAHPCWKSASLFASILTLSATRPIFNADLYVIDGSSGDVRAAVDYNDAAHWLDQASAANQCDLPAAHADYAGKLCLNFTGAEWYASNRTAAQWAFTTNGPFNLACVASRTSTALFDRIWSSRPGSGFGLILYYANNTTQVRFDLVRSGGSPAAINTGGTATTSPHAVTFTADAGASPQIAIKKSGVAATTTTFSGADVTPGSTATFAADGGGATPRFTGRVAVLGAWFPTLTAAGIATRDAWLATYGIAA